MIEDQMLKNNLNENNDNGKVNLIRNFIQDFRMRNNIFARNNEKMISFDQYLNIKRYELL